MLRKPEGLRDAPLVRAVNQIGDAWILLILWASSNGVTRFDDFQRELGVARNVLAERLKKLVENGLLEKTPIADGARRMEYRLTNKGEAFRGALEELGVWAEAWIDATQNAARVQAAE